MGAKGGCGGTDPAQLAAPCCPNEALVNSWLLIPQAGIKCTVNWKSCSCIKTSHWVQIKPYKEIQEGKKHKAD